MRRITGEAALYGLGVGGWAYGEGMAPLWLELLADDVVVSAGRADLPEPEGCGFWLPLPSFVAESPCTLRVRVANTSQSVGAPLSIPGGEVSASPLLGELTADAGQTLSGWVLDTTIPEKTLRVTARCEGRVVAEALAGERRYAPRQADGHGFVLHLPPELADGREYRIAVEDERGRPLPGSPLTFRTLVSGLAAWLQRQGKMDADGRALLLDVLRHMESRLPQAQGEARLDFWKKVFPVPAPPSSAPCTLSIRMTGGTRHDVAALWRRQKAPSCRLAADNADMTLLLRKGERLHPAAVAHLAAALQHTGAGMVYADGETTDADGHPAALCKPSWDRDAFMGRDYLGPVLVSRAVMEAVPPQENETASALRVRLALAAESLGGIRHVPYLLSEELPPSDGDARRAAWQRWLDVRHPGATIEAQEDPTLSRVRYPLTREPRVSVIIPSRDHASLLRRCMDGLLATEYGNLEILVVDNDTAEPEALALLEEIDALPQARVLRRPGIFNYAALNNDAVREASGELLCLCNNDTEMPFSGWLREMVALLLACGDQAGCVGAKLLWPNGLVQHGGVVVGTHQLACHAGNHWTADEPGYMARNLIVQQYGAVTAACLLTPGALFQELGGFDARRFPVTFNDVDYCLRLRAAGKKVLWTPFARLVHHESASRGKDTAPMNKARAEREMRAFRRRWPLYEDPFYNPNLPLCTAVEPFEGLALPPRARHAR
ncbi:glycosyltransferase family 2 protein [uncultured Desulfovibrio sp.]|uniref:glycosyltransferase family 2 protein n=1 Tax=uncultured Desulfovibrio sp. TaxID=167968 RepID=UPI002611C974|nr:glycosyltransferase family 2 protein [uncultured Desulfovibrio sp.]